MLHPFQPAWRSATAGVACSCLPRHGPCREPSRLFPLDGAACAHTLHGQQRAASLLAGAPAPTLPTPVCPPTSAAPQKLACFNLWRWCFFLGCWPLIYWASVWAMWALTQFCEWRLFAARTAVYFLVGGWQRLWVAGSAGACGWRQARVLGLACGWQGRGWRRVAGPVRQAGGTQRRAGRHREGRLGSLRRSAGWPAGHARRRRPPVPPTHARSPHRRRPRQAAAHDTGAGTGAHSAAVQARAARSCWSCAPAWCWPPSPPSSRPSPTWTRMPLCRRSSSSSSSSWVRGGGVGGWVVAGVACASWVSVGLAGCGCGYGCLRFIVELRGESVCG